MDQRVPSASYREQIRAMVLVEREGRDALVDQLCAVRMKHQFFRAHPDPNKRPEFMVCACGAMIPVTSTNPWDNFERHRVDQMLMALGLP